MRAFVFFGFLLVGVALCNGFGAGLGVGATTGHTANIRPDLLVNLAGGGGAADADLGVKEGAANLGAGVGAGLAGEVASNAGDAAAASSNAAVAAKADIKVLPTSSLASVVG